MDRPCVAEWLGCWSPQSVTSQPEWRGWTQAGVPSSFFTYFRSVMFCAEHQAGKCSFQLRFLAPVRTSASVKAFRLALEWEPCNTEMSFSSILLHSNGSALTIKWVWPLSRKSFQYYYLWRAKHRIFASVSKVIQRGSHLQVHVEEAVRYLTP